MKPGNNYWLNVAATIAVGLISSILILICSKTSIPFFVAAVPLLAAALACYVQYQFVYLKFDKLLAQVANKAQSITSKRGDESTSSDHIMVLETALASASEQIKEAEQREKSLVQHAADVICVIDLKGKMLSVNPASKSVWGYKPEELVGKQVTDFIVEEDVRNTMKSLMGAEKSIDKIYFENRFRKKSGQLVDMLWSAHVSATDRGLFCIAHDITDRKRAEVLLKESEERLRGILESLPAGVAVIAANERIEFMNETALQLTGMSKSDPGQLKASDTFGFYKESFADAFRSGQSQNSDSMECQIVRKTGEGFPAEVSTRIITWNASKACLVIFLDATLKHELERAKREFVAMVSHDLKTPLTSISLIFDSVLDGFCGNVNEQGMTFANRGKQACDRLMLLVQDLLDLEKMKAGKWNMEIVETALSELIDAALVAVESYAQAQEVKLAVDCPEIELACDGGRIIQVLVNLIGNAIKFSIPGGTVNVSVKDDDTTVRVSISNHGRKIPSDKLKAIFEKFEQADVQGALERKGTGLGLAISKSIVEQHGGEIWAESSEESGSVFSFTIPKFSEESANETQFARSEI